MSSGFEGIGGPWVAIRTEAPKGWNIEAREGTYTVAIVRDGNGRPENARHAFVIAEAGTVLHETGLTPRQLADQRAALLEALRKAQGLIAGVGYPADSSGRYHKDGAWTFDEAVPDHTNASAIEDAFAAINAAIALAQGDAA